MVCPFCGKEFELNGKRGGQNRVVCYDCLPECSDRNLRNKLRKQLLMRYSRKLKLERGCCRCGYNKCAAALEWHHIDRQTKHGNPSEICNKSITQFLEEIQQCEVLCANCHRELHQDEEEE